MEDSEIPKKIFWWTLFVLFWLTSATVIGYAFGYRFNMERGIFVYGGSVTLKTTPQASDVYINGILYSSKKLNRINNSYHIDGIEPGSYLLEVKSPGYATWSKRVTVHSGISTEFWNVILTKDSYLQTPYDSNGTLRFFISPKKNVTAVARQNGDTFSVSAATAADGKSQEIFSTREYSFTDNDQENIEWTPQAEKMIIPAIKNDTREKNYLIIDVSTKEVSNLKDIAGTSDLSHVRWDPKNQNVLFYISGGNLFRADLGSSSADIRQVAQNISGYELAAGNLYFFQLPEGMVFQTNLDGTDTPEQITRTAPDMSDPNYQIIAYDNDRLTLLNPTGDLYVFNHGVKDDYFQQLSNNALGSQFSDDGKKLLYWSDHEVFAYFVRDWDVQPTRSENEIMPVTRFVDPIKNVQWTRDYEHVILTVDNKLKLIELDQRDHRNIMDLISLNSDKASVVNNNSDALIYFTDTDQNGAITLHTIEFPERTTLLQTLGFGASTPAPQPAQQQ
ncbi:MAG TPA: PEGA domain-containing protein [Patescibacteria group bacterium]